MRIGRSATLSVAYAFGVFALVSIARVQGQGTPAATATATRSAAAPGAAAARPATPRTVAARTAPSGAPAPGVITDKKALLDQYCVTCHNNRLKTANFTL